MRKFDLVVIGGGVAGMVASVGAARFGARVAMVDNVSLGGDCLRAGCVPTKRLVQSAKVASLFRRAEEFGILNGNSEVDFRKVMEGMRRTRSRIAENDDPERFRKMGVEVVFGAGRFLDSHVFEVGGVRLEGAHFIIATGSRPVIPPIPGLREAGALTNETALELERLPSKLVILGAGPIGIEFAQIFSRLGSKVTVIEKDGRILPREDEEAAAMLRSVLESEGIGILTGREVREAGAKGGLREVVVAAADGSTEVLEADELMIAIGRAPNVDGLGLEAAGVEYGRKGIRVDEHLRTSTKHIYACGDVTGHMMFTNVAEYHAGVALGNIIFPLIKRKLDYRAVPWTTFSDPELARVGMTEAEAREKYGRQARVYRFPFERVDRAVIEGEAAGMVKVVCRGKRIVGAHILGPNGGELIHEYVLAMREKLPVGSVSRAMHVYPTLAMGSKRASDEYYAERLFKGWVPKAVSWMIRLERRGG